MRWRLLDKLVEFEVWRSASGIKLVSLEEYSLLEPLGRAGVLPETLILESCVELMRRFVAKSSGFELSCVLQGITSCSFFDEPGMGESLQLRLEILSRDEAACCASFEVSGETGRIASAELGFELCPLSEHYDPETIYETWS